MEFTSKREIAKQFVTLISNGAVVKAFSNYTASNFKHHILDCKSGKEALMERYEEVYRKGEGFEICFLRIIEQNDLVMAHLKLKDKKSNQESRGVFIFRLKDHLIQEYWEVIQAVPLKVLNDVENC